MSQPDLFVIPSQRVLATWTEITRLVLAVEALSPSTARNDRTVKRPYYQRVGVPEYWIVDLDAQLVERWRPNDERPEIVTSILEWRPTTTATARHIPLDELWSALPPA